MRYKKKPLNSGGGLVQESGDTAETLGRRIRGMRAVSEARKGAREGGADKIPGQGGAARDSGSANRRGNTWRGPGVE